MKNVMWLEAFFLNCVKCSRLIWQVPPSTGYIVPIYPLANTTEMSDYLWRRVYSWWRPTGTCYRSQSTTWNLTFALQELLGAVARWWTSGTSWPPATASPEPDPLRFGSPSASTSSSRTPSPCLVAPTEPPRSRFTPTSSSLPRLTASTSPSFASTGRSSLRRTSAPSACRPRTCPCTGCTAGPLVGEPSSPDPALDPKHSRYYVKMSP